MNGRKHGEEPSRESVINKQWEECLEIIRQDVTPRQYAQSFASVKLHSLENRKLVLSVPSESVKEDLEDKCIKILSFAIGQVFGDQASMLYFNTQPQEANLRESEMRKEG